MADWRNLQVLLSPISDTYLRKLLRESGHALDPLVEGVRQDTVDALERTLLALEAIYSAAEKDVRKQCRALVMEARQHAVFALRKAAPGMQDQRNEMIQWMRIWLENPGVFPVWLRVRKQNY